MAMTSEIPEPPHVEPPDVSAGAPTKGMTIGAVCKGLSQEFPDISISKIRYLEDQKLLNPRRTPGGYRLYSSSAGEASGTSVVSESSVTAPGMSACTCRSGARRRPPAGASRSAGGSRTCR